MGLYCSLCTTVTVISTGIYQFDNYAAEVCGAIPRAVRIPLDLVTPLVNCPPIIDNEPGWNIPLPWQNNDSNLDADQQEVIAAIVEVGQDVGASEQDIQIAIATCLVESQCKTGESVREKDHDSIGPFQQRPSQSWPDSEDPRVQARAFFEGHGTNKGLLDIGDRASNPGKAAQAVQRSAFPGRYAERMEEAGQILDSFKSGSGGSAQSGSAFPVQGITFSSNESKYASMGSDAHLFGDKRDNGLVHRGYDVACNVGQPLVATVPGTMVHYSDDPQGWGDRAFYVETSDGSIHIYGHAEKRIALDGAPVSAGDVIGECGSRGFSTGSHLHYEIRPAGMDSAPIDPTAFLQGI